MHRLAHDRIGTSRLDLMKHAADPADYHLNTT